MAKSAAVQYEVRYRITGTTQWGDIKTFAPTGEITVSGLDRNQQYDFQVRSVSACGARSTWVASAQTVPSSATPATVTTLNATSLADGVHLDWSTATTQPAGVEYSLERSPDNTTWAERVRLRGTAYTDPETSGTTYFYRVRAINFMGVAGGYSPVASNKGFSVSTLAAEVTSAQSGADAANAQLANIASDGILSPAEKPVVERDYAVILAEQGGIDGQAVNFLGAGSSQQQGYDNAITALTNYLATLSSPVSWSDKTGNTNINGPTFRANFNNVYTARQTLLNAIYARAQNLANGAQSSANNAQSSANNAQTTANNLNMLNLSFAQGITGWTPNNGDAANWYGETGGNGPNGGSSTYAVHKVSSVLTQLNNNNMVPVYPGQVIKATGQVKGVGSPNGAAALYISFYDISKNYISSPNSNVVSGNGSFPLSVTATAPANAAFAMVGPSCGPASGTPQGYWCFANFWWNYQPSSVDEVPDGSTYGRTSNSRLAPGNKPFIDFAETYHANKNIDNMADGGTYGRTRLSRMQNGVPIMASWGRNMCPNELMANNNVATPLDTALANGAPASDGWQVYNTAGFAGMTYTHGAGFNNLSSLCITVGNGASIPVGTSNPLFTMVDRITVRDGDQFMVSAHMYWNGNYAIPAGITFTPQFGIFFYDKNGAYLGSALCGPGANVQGYNNTSSGSAPLNGTGTAPAGTASALIGFQLTVNNANASPIVIPAGNYFPAIIFCNGVAVYQRQNLDNDVYDGTTYSRTLGSRVSSGRPTIDFSEGIHANKNIDNIGDGASFSRTLGSRVNAGRPSIDFSEGIHANKNIDNMGDGATYARTLGTRVNAGRPSIDFSEGIHANKTVDYIGDGAIYLRTIQQSNSAGAQVIDNANFSNGLAGWQNESATRFYVQGSSPTPAIGSQYMVIQSPSTGGGAIRSTRTYSVNPGDKISVGGLAAAVSGVWGGIFCTFYTAAGAYISSVQAATTTNAWTPVQANGTVPTNAAYCSIELYAGTNSYMCINYVWLSINDVRIQGSGAQIGDQRNLKQRTVTNVPAKVPTTISYNTSAGSPATATISVGAFTILGGSYNTSYNASSATVSGTGGTSPTYYLYMNDPGFAGGAQALYATTNGNDNYASDGLLMIGQVQVNFPTSGSSGGGGTGGGPCVCADMWLDAETQAGVADTHFFADCLDIPVFGFEKFKRQLQGMELSSQPCVRIVTDAGAVLECSIFTPFDLPGGGSTYAPDMEGREVITDRGTERVKHVIDIGEKVVCHQHYGGCSYAAGADPSHRIYSHNATYKP